jgi:hypothetical protein
MRPSRSWRGLLSLTCAAVLVAVPAQADAQACLGNPARPAQVAVVGGADFPDEAKTYGVTATYLAQGGLALYGRYSLTEFDVSGVNSANSVGGGLAFDLAPRFFPTLAGASICGVAGLDYGFWDQTFAGIKAEVAGLSVPLGLGFGTVLPLGDGMATVTPYVVPQWVFSRTTLKVAGSSESETDDYFGLMGGATLGFGKLLVGGSVSRVFETDAKTVFGVRAGFVF